MSGFAPRHCALGALAPFLLAGSVAHAAPPEVIELSLRDAIEAALVRGYAMRLARVDEGQAKADVKAGWASVYPKIDASLSYERTFLAPNPFAGSDAAALFSGAGTSDWVAFNERLRSGGFSDAQLMTVGQACAPVANRTDPSAGISFAEYVGCVGDGQAAGGVPAVDPGANPFLVENNVRAGLSLNQLLYSGAVFAGLSASDLVENVAKLSRERRGQEIARDVTRSYYGLLLARASVEVIEKSVERARATASEVRARVREGVVPQFQLLSAEVELANLETNLLSARDQAEAAADALAVATGIEVGSKIRPTDPLTMPAAPLRMAEADAATREAIEARPDVDAARVMIEARQESENATFARFFPELRLVANLSAVGNVPDDRTSYFIAPAGEGELLPGNPFLYDNVERGIFDGAYWGTSLTAGLNLTWNLFEGFATTAQLQRDQLEVQRAQVQLEMLEATVKQEVLAERRTLRSAEERVAVQARNVERAELNYRHAELRVKEGVSSQLELRDASSSLDQSRFNQLQAVHDYLVALASYRVALGQTSETEE